MKKTKLKQVGKGWSLMFIWDTKYCCLLPSLATIHKGHIWPIGISFKWFWAGASFVYVGK